MLPKGMGRILEGTAGAELDHVGERSCDHPMLGLTGTRGGRKSTYTSVVAMSFPWHCSCPRRMPGPPKSHRLQLVGDRANSTC